jgi:hypothetical protein
MIKTNLIFGFLLVSSSLFSQISSNKIDSLMLDALVKFKVAGASIAIVKDGKVIHQKGYGVTSIESKQPANEFTNYMIASNTKAFTTAALAILEDEGKIKWTDKVKDHIPAFKMYNDYVTENFNIQDLLTQIIPLEQDRIERVKQRIHQHLAEHIQADQIDANRFEQELIFYIEKLDFTEEKQRLTQHCSFFKEVLEDKEISKGKKLGFILQEVGREINTLGSKANDANIQQLVVKMKDELEKAKEQILNAL